MTDMLLGHGLTGENGDNTPNLETQQQYLLGNPNLPIAKHRAEIERALLEDRVSVIEATTGSGKSTQVVQYIHEMVLKGRLDVEEIILTQPRILPARSLSERIADEMRQAGVAQPKVGYYTQPEGSNVPQRQQDIAVLTEGKAAMQLLHRRDYDPNKLRYLAIDEVHEFGKFTELLLAIAHQKTDPSSPTYDENLRVVVMSATLDANRMKRYFSHTDTSLIQVKVPTYPVERSEIAESFAKTALKSASGGNTVLAFLAGKGEIESTQDAIAKIQSSEDPSHRIAVVPLHAQQNAEQQRLAFDKYDNGLVVLTTNVAETSITVPDATAVVDSGEVRIASTSYDYVPTGHNVLNLEDASQASINQRAGRVGRTGPGEHILAPQKGPGMPLTFKARPPYPVPSIERESLDDLVLFTKAIGQDIANFEFFHSPDEQAVYAAKHKLFMLGALDADGNITERGRYMDSLPLDPEYACMISYAYERGYNEEVKQNVLDIVAIMQRGGIFSMSPKEQRWKELLALDEHGEIAEQESDLFAQLEGYVELINNVPQKEWEDFDVNVHAVELIVQRRESLAKAVGIKNLQPAMPVNVNNRAAVMTCIHAAQLPQLWHRNGEQLHLLMGRSIDFDIHPSSVVANIGKLATGSLFSLGMRDEFRHSVQHITKLADIGTLDSIADHLIKEVEIPGSITYSVERQAVVIDVQRKLGPLVIKTIQRQIDTTEQNRIDDVLTAYADRAWRDFSSAERQVKIQPYKLEEINEVIENPDHIAIGTNPLTGEQLYAWRGADKWVRTKEAAIKSLAAYQKRLVAKPAFDERRQLKEELVHIRPTLIRISNGKGETAATAKALLREKGNTPDRLQRIQEFLAATTT